MVRISHRCATSALLAVFLSAGTAIAGGLPPEPICGDVNVSNTVTSSDALLVLKSSVGQPVTLECRDCPAVEKYGISDELPSPSTHLANYLLGSDVKITSSATVTHLSVIAKASGPQVKMALYTDDNGVPDELVVGTAAHTLGVGVQEIPVAATPVAAGHYWIMAIFDSNASIAFSNGEPNPPYAYRELAFSDPLPAVFGPANFDDAQSFSYYVKVIQ